jgi:hypothetical protein
LNGYFGIGADAETTHLFGRFFRILRGHCKTLLLEPNPILPVLSAILKGSRCACTGELAEWHSARRQCRREFAISLAVHSKDETPALRRPKTR